MSSRQTTENELAAVADAIRSNDRFLVTTHENPDGDALGSLLATKVALDALGKDATTYLGGGAPLPGEYAWMPFDGLQRKLPEDAAERVLLAVDCANESRLGPDPEVLASAPLVVNVDHHHDNTRFGAVNLVVPDASSTGEILRDLFEELGVELTPEIAEPLYIALVDKPAGPSSFAIVRDLRNRTGARAGHAGTLDPFATGLLLVLLGAFTKQASRFVGLDKEYETEVDLSTRTTTGDPEGDVVAEAKPPVESELLDRLEALRGEVDLPIPAASAVKIGGERAYKLFRRGVEVAMPSRPTSVNALDLLDYDGRVALLRVGVGSGGYVRSIAEALGGHCKALRRTAVGPFRVEDADPERLIPPEEALAAL